MAYYKRDMLSINTRNILAQQLAQSIFSACSLEPFREHLANVPHFECLSLFRYLDQDKKGYLTYTDLKRAMGNIQQKHLMYGFSRMDTLKIGEINRLEFAQFLLPKENISLQQLVAQRMGQPQSGDILDTLEVQVQIIGKMFLQIVIDQVATLSPIRSQLLASQDYSIKAVMSALDVDRHQFVSAQDIYKFVRGHGIDISKDQAANLIQTYDSNLDGKLQTKELMWAIEGLQGDNCQSYIEKLQNGPKSFLIASRKTKNNKQNEVSSKQKPKPRRKNKTEKNEQLLSQPQPQVEMPQSYVKSLKIYQQRQKAAQVVDKKLLSEEIQRISEIQYLKELSLRQLEVTRQRRIKAHIAQTDLKLQQELQIQMLIKLQAQRLDKLESEKLPTLSIQQEKIRLKQLERERAYQRIWLQKQCTRETGRTVSKHSLKSHIPNSQSIHPGKIYTVAKSQLKSSLRDPNNKKYDQTRPQLREHLVMTDVYLKRSQQLRQLIKKQRGIQRQIRNKLINYQINHKRQQTIAREKGDSYSYASPQKVNFDQSKAIPSTGKTIMTERKN